jgi:hypothetical protein
MWEWVSTPTRPSARSADELGAETPKTLFLAQSVKLHNLLGKQKPHVSQKTRDMGHPAGSRTDLPLATNN